MATSSLASSVSATRPFTAPADSSVHPLPTTPAPVLSSLPSQAPAMLQQAQPPGTGHGQQPVAGKPTLASYSATDTAPDGQGQGSQVASALPMPRKGSGDDAGEPDSDSEEEQQGTYAGTNGQARASGESSADSDADGAPIGEKDSDADEAPVGDPDSDADIAEPLDSLKPAARADTAAHGESTPMAQAFTGVTHIPASQINIGRFLANGAFGMVYRGTWGNTDVALKKIDFEHARQRLELSREEVNEALEWEVARLATTQHPNLVQFHGICHKDGAPYLVLEFCHQGSLQNALHKSSEDGNPIPASRLWQWMLEISQALAYLHEQGMLHRDLKAENILIDRHGRARLADLGVAQVDALLADNEASAVGQGLQDKSFIAPENLGNELKARLSSKATDIYALGLVFWQMVSGGAQPTRWETLYEQDPNLTAVRAGERMPIPADCPPQFKKLILACWSLYAAERASIADVLQQLRDMAPAMHADHALMALTMHLEQALHARRAEARHYVPCQVTLQPIEGSVEKYWERYEQHTGSAAMPNAPQPLQEVFDDFLAKPTAGSLLLLGEGGLGKSLSMCMLADRIQQQWWQHFADPASYPKPRHLSVFIRNHVDSWTHAALKNACADALQRHGLRPGQATPLVFVDGYDECAIEEENPGNLASHLGLPADARLIVTCRPGTVPEDQQEKCFAFAGKLQSCHYLSFGTSQLLSYLKQHLAWDEVTHRSYAAKLQGSAELHAVLRNPFVLYLLWQSWETVSKKPLEQLTRSAIYEGFIEHMVNSGKGMVEEAVLQQLQGSHGTLAASFTMFIHKAAVLAANRITRPADVARHTGSAWAVLDTVVQQQAQHRYKERHSKLASMSEEEIKEQSRRMVLTEDDFVRLQRQKASRFASSLPLRLRAGVMEFIHKSVFEHCLAQRLLEFLGPDNEEIKGESIERFLNRTRISSPEALMMLREGLQAREAAQSASSAKPSAGQQGAEAQLLASIGVVLHDKQLFVSALEYQLKALALKEQVFGTDHISTAMSYDNIGVVLEDQGKLDQALQYCLKALAIHEKVFDNSHHYTAGSYLKIGGLLSKQGKYDQAIEYGLKALPILKEAFGANHTKTANVYNSIGISLTKQGKHAQALEYFLKALAIEEKDHGADHVDTAMMYDNIGALLQNQGKYDQAMAYHLKALAIHEKVFGTEHTDTAMSYSHIGHLLMKQSKHDEAMEYYLKAIAICERVFGTDHRNTGILYNHIGSLLQDQGNYPQALVYLFKALATMEKVFGTDHKDIAISYSHIGALLTKQGKHDQALEYLLKSLAIEEKVFGTEHTGTATSYNNIGLLLQAQGKHDQAMEYYLKALAIWEKVLGTEHIDTATAYNNIGKRLRAQGKDDQALEYYLKALAIREKILGADHPRVARSYTDIAFLLKLQGNHAGAVEYLRKALANAIARNHPDAAIYQRRIESLTKTNPRS